jgi:hypothetical protein
MSPFFSFSEIYPFARDRKDQLQYLSRSIAPELQRLEAGYREKFPGVLRHKILDYYAVFVPVVLGRGFCSLFGRTLTAEERRLQTLLGVITPFFDDFFDIERLTDAQIFRMMEDPFHSTPGTMMQDAFIGYGKEILTKMPDETFFRDVAHRVYEAQILSRRQESEDAGQEEIKQITAAKGGNSLLFYYSALSLPHDESLLKMVYQTGSLLQLSNDIFDAYKDREKGIRTLVACYEDIALLKQYFTDEYHALTATVLNLPFPRKNIRQFFFRINLMLTITFVALKQFAEVQERNGGRFILSECSRKDLICDRDRKLNMIRWLKYTYWLQ